MFYTIGKIPLSKGVCFMSGSVFGTIFRVSTWGESHGKAIGAVIAGCPAGLPLCEADIPVSYTHLRLLHFVYVRIPVTVFYVQRALRSCKNSYRTILRFQRRLCAFDTANVQISIQTGDLYLITGQISGLDVTVFVICV